MTGIELARMCPTGLARLAAPGYVRAPWIALLERRLLDLAAGRTKRLRVAVPIRHGKSELIARFFIAHYLLTHPEHRVILACATASLAEMFSRKIRDLIIEYGPLFGVKLRSDSRAIDRWDLVQGGGLIAAGAGSSIVGRGAQLIVGDDVIAGNETASSKTALEKLVSWWKQDLMTRLEPGGAAVLVGTRWAELDVHGVLEQEERQGGEHWETLILAALCEDPATDPLGRKEGEALFPARFPAEELVRIRGTLLSAFSGLYQQRPIPREGGDFKAAHAKRYKLEDGFLVFDGGERVSLNLFSRFLTIDTATTERTTGDYSAIAAWGVHGSRLALLDLDMRRLDGTKLASAIKAMIAKHSRRDAGCVAWIEETVGSKHLLSFLAAEGVVFRTLKPDTNKRARATPAAALLEQGRLVLPACAPWLGEYEHQLFMFPSGAHDDAVDVTSYAAQVFIEHYGSGGEAWPYNDQVRGPQPHILDSLCLPSPGPACSVLPPTPSFFEGPRPW